MSKRALRLDEFNQQDLRDVADLLPETSVKRAYYTGRSR